MQNNIHTVKSILQLRYNFNGTMIVNKLVIKFSDSGSRLWRKSYSKKLETVEELERRPVSRGKGAKVAIIVPPSQLEPR